MTTIQHGDVDLVMTLMKNYNHMPLTSSKMHPLTPSSLPQPVKFPGCKVHIYTPENSIFDGPITNLPSVLCMLIEVLLTYSGEIGKKP